MHRDFNPPGSRWVNPHHNPSRFYRRRLARTLFESGVISAEQRDAIDPGGRYVRPLPACRCYCGLVTMPVMCDTCQSYMTRRWS